MTTASSIREFSQFAELKQLAFNLSALQRQEKFRSLAVLSFFPGEGKTLFCASAAVAYAEASRARVLIIDTSTRRNGGSLTLNDCLNPAAPGVEVVTMEDIRKGFGHLPGRGAGGARSKSETIHEPEVVDRVPAGTGAAEESDSSWLHSATEEGIKSHDLILLDTVPISIKNKSNIDPLLVARQSDASILIVGRKLLEAADVKACMRVAQDPTIRLVGLVANEEFAS